MQSFFSCIVFHNGSAGPVEYCKNMKKYIRMRNLFLYKNIIALTIQVD